MPRKIPDLDLDFNIYVDPSCLSDPMDDTLATQLPSDEVAQDPVMDPETPESKSEDETKDVEQPTEDCASPPEQQGESEPAETTPAVDPVVGEQPEIDTPEQVDETPEQTEQTAQAEQTPEQAAEQEPVTPAEDDTPADIPQESSADVPVEEPPAPDAEDAALVTEADEPPAEDITVAEPASEPEAAPEAEAEAEAEVEVIPEPEPTEDPVASEPVPEPEEQQGGEVEEPVVEEAVAEEPAVEEPPVEEPVVQESPAEEPPVEEPSVEEASVEEPAAEEPAVEELAVEEPAAEEPATEELTFEEPSAEESAAEPAAELAEEAIADTQEPQDSILEPEESAREVAYDDISDDEAHLPRGAGPTDRKTSLRTEALIQAAARAVVAKIEKRKSQDGVTEEDDEFEPSMLSTASQETFVPEETDAQSTFSGRHSPARHIPSRSMSSDEGGNSSSHNEPDDDVFSERSARSSICSLDAADHHNDDDDMDVLKTPHASSPSHLSRRESFASTSTRPSPRAISGLSMISGFSQYDDKHFVPTSRENRMPFRTPSEIRAMQMASPSPSVFNGSSPRSAKRHSGGIPSISRLGSPTVSAQYSPKGRSTPPRFKSRKEAPLVLLHVTLLPLRWVWGDVLNGLDSVLTGKPGEEQQQLFEPSDQLRTLRDAWRELQECVGDTVLERGILLPHPQNDYEVLEERLLEALELPVKRRARILECGHYLGPANDMGDEEMEEEEEEEEGMDRDGGMRHWCNTCRNEIRYEQLGPGKVFRVKVYASNGLMKAGAWEACWNEMERVDVEVEPLVEPALQGELEKLGALQLELEDQRRQQQQQQEAEMERAASAEPESTPEPQQQLRSETPAREPEPETAMQLASSSIVPISRPVSRATEPIDISDERRRRDEERMREIYGDMPSAPAQPQSDPYQQQHQPQQHPAHSQALTMVAAPQPQQQPLPTHRYPHDQHPHAHPHPDPYHSRPSSPEHHNMPTQQRRPGIVLDENAGFVDILMEAFKVLLRDPKNVAIIVLCVFVGVMLHRPGVGVEKGLEVQTQSAARYPAEVPVQVPQVKVEVPEVSVQAPMPVMQVSGLEMGHGVVEKVVPEMVSPVVEAPKVVEVAPVVEVEAKPEPELMPSVPVEEVLVEVEVPVEVEVEEVTPVVEEAEPEVEPVQAVEEVKALRPTLADILALWALQYPTCGLEDEAANLVPETATEAEDVTAEVVEDAQAETTVEEVNSPDLEKAALPEEETSSATEECAAPEEQADADLCESKAEPEPEADTDNDDHPACDIPSLSPSLPTPSVASASTSSLFIPGPYVTERKTVRVFETVTETVRVSVVTQTETVSTVVTAVPQTVEETVYETETVRITVSVPVAEKEKAKAAGSQGKARVCGAKGV